MSEKEIIQLLKIQRVLTAEEERSVFRYYKEHPSLELRNLIVMKNIGLVRQRLMTKVTSLYRDF